MIHTARISYLPGKHFLLFFLASALVFNFSMASAAGLVNNIPAPEVVRTGVKESKNKESMPPVTIVLKVVQNVMQYDKKTFTVKAGQKVTIDFENPDFMQHNLVIMKPGSKEKVGAAADLLAADPNGATMNYVPKIKEVLFSTKLLPPQEKASLQFTAPAAPGDYPYMCTFPGHWRIMFGTMKVTK